LGGVCGAIAEHVKKVEETIHRELGGTAPSRLLPKVFQSLVIVNPEGLPTRRRPLLAEFPRELRPAVDLLIRERLLHTEGEGEKSTVSISHEKLFEAWPALQQYVLANKKLLMDQTLLESRARKWFDMGRPWFSGLATGRELKDLRREGVSTPYGKEYLSASRRAVLLRRAGGFVLVGIVLLYIFAALVYIEELRTMRVHIEPEMVEIAPGSFNMGDVLEPDIEKSPWDRGDWLRGRWESAGSVHVVQIQKPFKIARYEVTFEEYDRFALTTGRGQPDDMGLGRGRQPVINVSWGDAVAYAEWLSKQTRKRYRLPSEAEWEYAALGSGKEKIWAGTSREEDLVDYAWYGANSKRRPRPVGTRKPNSLGIHDMSGNVWEWVEDCWHDNYNGAPADGSAWKETGGGVCGIRLTRGGSWVSSKPVSLRSSNRRGVLANFWDSETGFRLAQDID
jgi:formylglycine-generating enzyme required for sulfatase activity